MVKEIKDSEFLTFLLHRTMVPGIKFFLNNLRSKNVTVKIVSTSWYPITEHQWQEYLFYVSETLGLGFLKEEILTLNDPGPIYDTNKGKKIREDMDVNEGRVETAMFVDDSLYNIMHALDVCNSFYITGHKTGIKTSDKKFIKASTKKFKGV